MNQILPVGKGIVLAVEQVMPPATMGRWLEMWKEQFPDVPMIVVSEAQIVLKGDKAILFEFTGDITPTFVAEFKRWWEEVQNAVPEDPD